MAIKLIWIFCFVCVFVVWISHYKVLMQVFQGIKRFGYLYQNISSVCRRESCNETLQELCSKMNSVTPSISVFAGSLFYFLFLFNQGYECYFFASMLTSHTLFTSDQNLHNELSPFTTQCVYSPVSLFLWEEETQLVSLTCDPVTSSEEEVWVRVMVRHLGYLSDQKMTCKVSPATVL